jgi:hypothetical protein
MSRGPHSFKQTDVTRAIKAAEAAGKEVVGVEMHNGKIRLLFGHDPAEAAPAPGDNWNDALSVAIRPRIP